MNYVSAISIGVKPTKVEMKLKIGEQVSTEMLVKNTGPEPALYKIFPDKYGRNIKIVPSEFKLDGSEEKIVNITTRFWLPGKNYTDISVVARPLNASPALSLPGIKIPFESSIGFSYVFYGMLLLALILLVFVVKWRWKKK